tara:strand:+ start:611 stop:817 length:207 start_codon:yes stop_codon:yes gene_type:complete
MKQAEADIARLEKEYADWADHPMRTDQLESAREKYRSLKYEYTIQSSILILVAFTAVAVLASYLFGGV